MDAPHYTAGMQKTMAKIKAFSYFQSIIQYRSWLLCCWEDVKERCCEDLRGTGYDLWYDDFVEYERRCYKQRTRYKDHNCDQMSEAGKEERQRNAQWYQKITNQRREKKKRDNDKDKCVIIDELLESSLSLICLFYFVLYIKMFINKAAYAEYCTFFLSANSCIIHFYATASSPSGFTSFFRQKLRRGV
jgi:hypothetical protein